MVIKENTTIKDVLIICDRICERDHIPQLLISIYKRFSDRGKFSAKEGLLHEWVNRTLGYKKLKCEAWLYFDQGAISPN